MHPQHRITERYNNLLKHKNNAEVYDLIAQAQDITGICSLFNYNPQDNNYNGYSDSKFFKVSINYNTLSFFGSRTSETIRRALR